MCASFAQQRVGVQFKKNYFTEMRSDSEAGSYLRLIDFVYHSTLGLGVIKKSEFTAGPQAASNCSSGVDAASLRRGWHNWLRWKPAAISQEVWVVRVGGGI